MNKYGESIGNAFYNININNVSSNIAKGIYNSTVNLVIEGIAITIYINGQISYLLDGPGSFPTNIKSAEIFGVTVTNVKIINKTFTNVSIKNNPAISSSSIPTTSPIINSTKYVLDFSSAIFTESK